MRHSFLALVITQSVGVFSVTLVLHRDFSQQPSQSVPSWVSEGQANWAPPAVFQTPQAVEMTAILCRSGNLHRRAKIALPECSLHSSFRTTSKSKELYLLSPSSGTNSGSKVDFTFSVPTVAILNGIFFFFVSHAREHNMLFGSECTYAASWITETWLRDGPCAVTMSERRF